MRRKIKIMKIISTAFLVIFIVTISSCRKSYSCACATTIEEPGYIPYKTLSNVKIAKNTSEKKALKICESTAKQMQANAKLIFSSSYKIKAACTIQLNN
jgi:hypothetical protein